MLSSVLILLTFILYSAGQVNISGRSLSLTYSSVMRWFFNLILITSATSLLYVSCSLVLFDSDLDTLAYLLVFSYFWFVWFFFNSSFFGGGFLGWLISASFAFVGYNFPMTEEIPELNLNLVLFFVSLFFLYRRGLWSLKPFQLNQLLLSNNFWLVFFSILNTFIWFCSLYVNIDLLILFLLSSLKSSLWFYSCVSGSSFYPGNLPLVDKITRGFISGIFFFYCFINIMVLLKTLTPLWAFNLFLQLVFVSLSLYFASIFIFTIIIWFVFVLPLWNLSRWVRFGSKHLPSFIFYFFCTLPLQFFLVCIITSVLSELLFSLFSPNFLFLGSTLYNIVACPIVWVEEVESYFVWSYFFSIACFCLLFRF